MRIDQITRQTKITKSLICFYGKAGSGLYLRNVLHFRN